MVETNVAATYQIQDVDKWAPMRIGDNKMGIMFTNWKAIIQKKRLKTIFTKSYNHELIYDMTSVIVDHAM